MPNSHAPLHTPQQQIDWLRSKNQKLHVQLDDLEFERDELRREIGLKDNLPGWVPLLTPMQRDILRMLFKREIVSRDMIVVSVYDGDHARAERSLHVHICKLRKALKPRKIHIENIWGVGWRIETASRKRLQKMTRGATQ